MSPRVKTAAVALLGILLLVYGYVTYGAVQKSMPTIIAYNKAHPVNWVDVGLGAIAGILTAMIAIIAVSFFEIRRFERSVEKNDPGDDPDGGGGGAKTVRMPMSRKLVTLKNWRKVPTDGRIHRGSLSPEAALSN